MWAERQVPRTLLVVSVVILFLIPVELGFFATSGLHFGLTPTPNFRQLAFSIPWLKSLMEHLPGTYNFVSVQQETRSADFQFLALLLGAALLLYFGLPKTRRLRRTLLVMSLFALQLPIMIWAFDPFEFNLYFVSALNGTPLKFLTNQFLIYPLASIIITTAFPEIRAVARTPKGTVRLLTFAGLLVLGGVALYYGYYLHAQNLPMPVRSGHIGGGT